MATGLASGGENGPDIGWHASPIANDLGSTSGGTGADVCCAGGPKAIAWLQVKFFPEGGPL